MDQPANAMITEKDHDFHRSKAAAVYPGKLRATIEAMQGGASKASREGGKVLFCGHGGNTTDGQHLTAAF